MTDMTFLEIAEMTEAEARSYLEEVRWPDGPICPHCGAVEKIYKLAGEAHRKGLWKCGECRRQFTVTVGTIMHRTRLSLKKWALAFHIMAASKKGVSAHQLHRQLKTTYKTAWFLSHRIRAAMKEEPLKSVLKGDVEVDETYVGGKPRYKGDSNYGRGTKKTPVMALVERDGKMKAKPIKRANAATLKRAIRTHVDPSATIHTDDYPAYRGIGKEFAGHTTVRHSYGEYVRGNASTNTVESFFAVLKRAIHGTFHHVAKHQLHRYCDEFSFRWNTRKGTDTERAEAAIRGSARKRLTYYPTKIFGAAAVS